MVRYLDYCINIVVYQIYKKLEIVLVNKGV